MFLSAVVVFFAFLIVTYYSIEFNFYLLPILLLFSWAFLVFALSRFIRFPRLLLLFIALSLFIPVYTLSSRFEWKINSEKKELAISYLNLVTKALQKYYADKKNFPVNENFKEVMWIISELELANFREIKYRTPNGKSKVVRFKKPPLRDPWGTPYIYEGEGNKALLMSSGPDLLINTKDDIVIQVNPN